MSGPLPKRLLQRSIPYKLFELVAGAVLEAKRQPGATLVAEIPIATPVGRRFRFRAATPADANGTARFRVSYATDADAPARAVGRYRIRFGGASWPVQVPDAAVRAGTVLAITRLAH